MSMNGYGVADTKVRRSSLRTFKRFISIVCILVILAAMIISFIPTMSSSIAMADDAPGADFSGCPDDSSADADSRQACGIMNATGPDGRKIADKGDTYNKAFGGDNGFIPSLDNDLADHGILEVWPMMAYRILGPSYYLNSSISTDAGKLNQQGSGVHAWKPNRECKGLDDPSSYTNDNCDIPGVATQGIQDVLYSVLPHGIKGGERKSARSPYNIGIPVELIPDGHVPVNRGSNRFTGMELVGYNLSWTSYVGEWDKIDVDGSTRMASSISVLSGIGKAFQSVSAGVSKAVGNANADVSQAWNEGNLIKIAGSIVSWPFKSVFKGASDSTYNFAEILLNGYEDNVINSPGAWNRDSFYTDTAYNVRVMSDQERGQVYLALVQALVEQTTQIVADKYNVDVADLENQSAFPSSKPDKVTKGDGSGDDAHGDGPGTEREAWDRWVSRNKPKLQWGADVLGVDYKSFAPGDNGTASGQVDALASAWNGKATEWRTTKMKERLKDNLDSYSNILAGDEIREGTESMKKYAKDSLSHGSLFWVCTNDDGTPQGQADNGIIKTAMTAGLRDPGLSAFDSSGHFRCKDSNGRVGDIRPPISGALFGQAGSTAQKARTQDTRRMPGRTMTSLLDPVGNLSGFMLSLSQKVAMGINFMVNLAFQPLLDSLGIKPVVLDVIKTLRSSFYLQLLILIIILSVLMAFIKSIRSGPVEGVKSIILVAATAVLGIALLFSPDVLFRVVDEYPAAAERMVAAIILQADGSPNTDLCSSTSGPKGLIDASQYKDANGSMFSGFDPNTTIRRVECNVWDAYVFEPWSLGQFGAGYSQLYANGHAPGGAGSFKEDSGVTKLVGDAGVNMGGGAVINNWALYQADLQTSGTSTDDDSSKPTGSLDKNMYRIVDLQAGPDKAAGRDSSHWGEWKGSGSRFVISMIALASSVGGVVSIGMFSIAKISAMLIMALLLAVAPIMLLVGIIPGAPRRKMRSWMMQIVGQGLKRIILTALLSLQLVILLVVANSNGVSPITSMVFTCAMSWIFVAYGKSILRAFLDPVENAGAGMYQNDDRMRRMVHDSRFMTSLRNAKTTFSQVGGAMVGATIAGGLIGQNSNQARMNRYEDSERKRMDNSRNSRIKGIQRQREHLMDLYSNGMITGAEYHRRQSELNASESQINRKYRNDISHIQDYRKDTRKLADVLNNNKVETEASEQMRRVMNRTTSLGRRRQDMLGHVRFAHEAWNATRSERSDQINDAYRAIFINNPNIAAGLLGLNTSQAKNMRELFKGVDFRDVADDLNLNASMSADDVITEMEDMGYRFKKGPDGDYVPVFSPETIAVARERVSDAAAADDARHGRSSAQGSDGILDRFAGGGPGHAAKLGRAFSSADASAEQTTIATDIAQKYLPRDMAQNEATHSPTSEATVGYDPVAALKGDASADDVRADRDFSDMIDYRTGKREREIMDDNDLSDSEKSEAIAKLRKDARDEKNRHSSSQMTAIYQATNNAGNEIMKIADGLEARGYRIEENPSTGALSYRDTRTGRFREDMSSSELSAAASAGADKDMMRVIPLIDDYRQMDASIRLHSPSAKSPGSGRTGAIRFAMKQGDALATSIRGGANRYADGDYRSGIGTKIHGRRTVDPVADGTADVPAGSRGSGLTNGLTGAQKQADIDAADARRTGEDRRRHSGSAADGKAFDADRDAERIAGEKRDYHANTGRDRSHMTRPDTKPYIS